MPPTLEPQAEQLPEPELRGEPAMRIPEWVGPFAGFIVILLIVGMGGLYLWGSMLSVEDLVLPPPERINDEPETVRAEADVSITETVSSSDSIDAIAADIDSTLLDTFEQDLQAMDSEVESFIRSISTP